MDLITLVTVLAGIVAILGFLYIVIFGQRSIPEWLEDRRQRRVTAKQSELAITQSLPRKLYHNLPQPDYTEFIGRKEAFKKILELLSYNSRHFLVVIEGFSGIGKTALALAVTNHLLISSNSFGENERFEAIIWTSAKQQILTAEGVKNRARTEFSLEDIFTTVAIVLERDDITRARPEEQREIVRTLLTKRRSLLIVDSLETIDDPSVIEFLRDLPSPTKVIITSRQRIDVSYPIRLEPLPNLDAKRLIDQQCKEKNAVLNEAQKQTLYEETNGVPIAIVWSIAQIGFGFSADATIKRLTSRQLEHDLVQFCFYGIFELIREKDEFRVLLALSLFTSSANLEAIGAITGFDKRNEQIENAIVQLAKLSLLTRLNDHRVAILNLTRTFAAIELERSPFSSDYKDRFIQYYERYTKEFGGYSLNESKLLQEFDNIKLAVEIASQLQLWESYVELVLNISRFLYVRGFYGVAQKYWDQIRSLTLLSDHPELRIEASKVFALGGVMYSYLRNERTNIALEFLKESLPILQEAKDYNSLSLITQRLGILSRGLAVENDFSVAKEYLEQAQQYALSISDYQEEIKLRRLADALNGLGSIAILDNDYDLARRSLKESDELFQKLGDISTRSSVIRHQAEIARLKDEFKEAIRLCSFAIQLAQDADRKDRLADAFEERALIEFARRKRSNGLKWARKAIETYISIRAHSDAKRIEVLLEQYSKSSFWERIQIFRRTI